MYRLRHVRALTAAALAGLTVVFAQAAAQAHYVWAIVEKGQVRFALLENLSEPANPDFASYVATLAPKYDGKALPLGAVKGGARFATLPARADPGVIVAESVVGARERNGESYLLVYEIKGAVSLGAAGAVAGAPAEILARRDGGDLVVSVKQSGKPVPECPVWIQWPGIPDAANLTTDAHGEARAPWLKTNGGTLGVRALVTEAKPGTAEGKHYDSIHRWATLTFPVETSPAEGAAAAAGPEPLTQMLKRSFGKNHTVVSEAALNQTIFGGKLTRAQLLTFLQQRALIHGEVDRILRAADPALHIPYGPEQKNVPALLRADLKTLGVAWPTDADARPSTLAFLQELRESEKKGPYFALGVWHVYYGGTTNGGRMIGEQIHETLGFDSTYFAKSDGYRPYLKEVDKIADPAARDEMLRGGQEVYKYIIASTNEDVYKAK